MKHLKKLVILGSMLGMMGMASAAEARTTVVISTAPVYAVRPQPYYVNTFYGPPAPVAYRQVVYRDYYRDHRYHRHDRHNRRHDRDRHDRGHWHR